MADGTGTAMAAAVRPRTINRLRRRQAEAAVDTRRRRRPREAAVGRPQRLLSMSRRTTARAQPTTDFERRGPITRHLPPVTPLRRVQLAKGPADRRGHFPCIRPPAAERQPRDRALFAADLFEYAPRELREQRVSGRTQRKVAPHRESEPLAPRTQMSLDLSLAQLAQQIGQR